jgi:uncharacterized surface protein with fasciclin (FAS1) repeats
MKKILGVVAALGISSAVMAGGGYQKDLINTAENAGNFETLVSAVGAADLEEKLKGDGPFTLFAPTDDAFAALPEGKVDELLMPENKDKLVELLSYHVVPGKILSSDITADTESVENLAGSELSFDLSDGVMINAVSVTKTDIEARNGVIHVVDEVIMPANWPSS